MFEFIEDEGLRAKAEEEYNKNVAGIAGDIQSKIDAAVEGLKNKNNELLKEKKTIAETLKNFENIDPEKAREALKFLSENEYAQLLKDGKIDELMEKKTQQLKADHEAFVAELNGKLESATSTSTKYQTLYNKKMIEDQLQSSALKAGVLPEALSDVLNRGGNIFTLDENGKIEARDKDGKLVKVDGDKILTADIWMDTLKVTNPYYWPASAGAGAGGGTGADDLADQIAAAAKSGNQKLYRSLREKQRAKK